MDCLSILLWSLDSPSIRISIGIILLIVLKSAIRKTYGMVWQNINPFQTNGLFHKDTYNEVRMVHLRRIFRRVAGYNFQIKCISFYEDHFCLLLANSSNTD